MDERRVNTDRRDRDETGRPRSARPRDGLGRPLPRGAVGVPRVQEGQVREPADTIAQAQRFLDSAMPFHAHEVFEDAWKSAPEAERPLWQGLAQLAVGLTHLLRGNPTGARALLARGAERIRPFAVDAPYGLDVAGVLVWADAVAASPEVADAVSVVADPAEVPVPRLTGRR